MYARLRSLGYPALLFESIEGGHTSTATIEERAFNAALEVIYFYQKIFDHK
jgi:prolyl oligopeptidase PreP (S9A serine peptidase family)